MKKHYLFILVFLLLFWLLLSGHGEPLILAFGMLSSLLVTLLVIRMDRNDREPVLFRPGIRIMHYFGWLLWQVVLSNIDDDGCPRRSFHDSQPHSGGYRGAPEGGDGAAHQASRSLMRC